MGIPRCICPILVANIIWRSVQYVRPFFYISPFSTVVAEASSRFLRHSYVTISNSVLTKAYIKFRRSRPHQCLTQERLRFETFYKITQKHFNGDQFYQRIKKNEY